MPGIPFEGRGRLGRTFSPTKPYVPPGGFAGSSSQTVATQAVTFRPASIAGFQGRSMFQTKRRRKKKHAAAKSSKRRTRRAPTKRGKLKRLIKGSKAAKAYMAKIRRKRR